jgi:hypothetical protein
MCRIWAALVSSFHMGDTEERTRAILDEARNAVVGGAAASAAAALGSSPLTTGIMGAVPATLATIVSVGRVWKEWQAKKWWHEVICGGQHDGKSPEEVAGIIASHLDEPFVRETILRSLRALLEAPDDCTVTPLAMLAREYIHDHRPPDHFFRGVASLLGWCTRDTFDQLHRIATHMSHGMNGADVPFVRLHTGQLREGLMKVAYTEGSEEHVEAPDGARIIRRLCREELATQIGLIGEGSRDDMAHCRIYRDVGLHLARILLA